MVSYLLLALVAILILILVEVLWKRPSTDHLVQMIRDLTKQNQELLNRLQAPDVRTFLALQNSFLKIDTSEVVPRDDESEAARFADVHGLGEVIYDEDEVRKYHMQDFGLGVSDFDR